MVVWHRPIDSRLERWTGTGLPFELGREIGLTLEGGGVVVGSGKGSLGRGEEGLRETDVLVRRGRGRPRGVRRGHNRDDRMWSVEERIGPQGAPLLLSLLSLSLVPLKFTS